ncbi:MAG: hypothetical protein P4L65_03890 [Legionella sp.]|nr:hypothetical protein [Legionella sp.]
MKLNGYYKFFIILSLALLQTWIFYCLIYPEFYINGDNEFYQRAFNSIRNLPFSEAYQGFKKFGGSGDEPISFAILYSASQIMSYSTYFYVSNFIFIFFIGFVSSKLYKHWVAIYFLVAFSFYVFILKGLTQRLAIAFFFLMLSVMFQPRLLKLTFYSLSILAHWQMIILFISSNLADFLNNLFKGKIQTTFIFFLMLIVIVFYYFADTLLYKLNFYLGTFSLHSNAFLVLLWPLLLVFCGYKLSFENLLFFIITFTFAVFLASGRLNIVCFFYCIYLMRENEQATLRFLMILFPYFICKHYNFYMNYYHPGIIFGN